MFRCKTCGAINPSWSVQGMGTPDRCSSCPPPWWQVMLKLLMILGLVFGLVGGFALYGRWAYGDWSCGFKHCREVIVR